MSGGKKPAGSDGSGISQKTMSPFCPKRGVHNSGRSVGLRQMRCRRAVWLVQPRLDGPKEADIAGIDEGVKRLAGASALDGKFYGGRTT